MFLDKLRQLHATRCKEPLLGNRLRETIQVAKEILHVRKCNEAPCPRCVELGLNGGGPLYSNR
jgi:hypothetical protein